MYSNRWSHGSFLVVALGVRLAGVGHKMDHVGSCLNNIPPDTTLETEYSMLVSLGAYAVHSRERQGACHEKIAASTRIEAWPTPRLR